MAGRPNLFLAAPILAAAILAPVLAIGADTATQPTTALDPSTAVVTEGVYLYRQRDLDALVQVALRHLRQKPTREDEEQLRSTITLAMTAREPLIAALKGLPTSLTAKARDALILDLVDYQADPLPPRPLAPPSVAPSTETEPAAPITPITAMPTGAGTQADAAPTRTPAASAPTDPVMVRLPPLTLVRTIDGVGRRQLTLGLALYFPDAETSKRFENQAPLIQDAILGQIHQLPGKEFVEPNQLALKESLIKAIQAKVADFPADGLLIPQLESGAADPDEHPAK